MKVEVNQGIDYRCSGRLTVERDGMRNGLFLFVLDHCLNFSGVIPLGRIY